MIQDHPTAAERSLAELVHDDARTARVFEQFGLDFCCHGRRTLREAADEQQLPLDPILSALQDLGVASAGDAAPAEWQDLAALTRHIVNRHHGYVRATLPAITAWLDRLVAKHGERHPELDVIRQTFKKLSDELTTHMMKEENILFPYIEDLAKAHERGAHSPSSPFGTVHNPIRMMEAEHELAGELAATIRAQSSGYVPPADACTTYRLCYAELQEFERDLHRHVHLENYVLFPRAVELERALA
jgi:regulator of cell morphogenesis and NO signaling